MVLVIYCVSHRKLCFYYKILHFNSFMKLSQKNNVSGKLARSTVVAEAVT